MPQIINLSPIGEVLPGDSLPIFDESNGDTRRVSVDQLETYMQNNLDMPDNSDEVSFLQAGTGAVTRTAQSKLRETISVLDFGAVGDGVNDDTAEIQAAFTYAGTVKGVVLFPPTAAHYKITSAVDVPLDVDIYALNATVKRYHLYTVNNWAFFLRGNNVVYGMTYDASAVNDPTNFTLYHDFSLSATAGGQEEFFRFDSCTFISSPGSFILGSPRDLIVTGCKFYDYKDHCVYFGNSTTLLAQNVLISNNVFRCSASTTREAVKIRNGVLGITVANNEFYLPTAYAMTFDFGDAVNPNQENTRILVSGNNGVCIVFIASVGNFDGADGGKNNSEILVSNNLIDSNYFFLSGSFNWTTSSQPGSFDSITIQNNVIKGGIINVVGQKSRPVRAGSGATATAVLTGSAVTSITLGSGGSGYTSAPVISLRDSTNTGFGATAKAVVSGGAITGFSVLTGGTGYVTAPTVYLEEYGVNSLVVKNNTFLPREETGSTGPWGVFVSGDVGYSDISENTFEALTSNFYNVNAAFSPGIPASTAYTKEQVANDVTLAGACKPRIFRVERNYVASVGTFVSEPAAGLCSDGSFISDTDTFIIKENIFDLKLAAAGAVTPVVTAGTDNRGKWYLSNNKQLSSTTGRTAPDYTAPRTTWANPLNVVFADPGAPAGAVTYDPPSIAAGGQATTTVTATGAFLGDTVTASFSNSLGGLTLSAYVSSTNTVTCVFFNPTAGAIDLASGTLRVKVVY